MLRRGVEFAKHLLENGHIYAMVLGTLQLTVRKDFWSTTTRQGSGRTYFMDVQQIMEKK